MKKLFAVAILIVSFSFIVKKETNNIRAELLAGLTFKKWNIVDNTPKSTSASCNYPNDHSMDNTWIFHNNHNCSFDPGQIRESLEDNLSCKDPRPFTGSWQLLENETKLKINIVQADNQPTPANSFLLFQIERIEQDTMILILNENSNTNKYVFITK